MSDTPKIHPHLRVLLVENDPMILQMLADDLRTAHHEVETANDGLEGLRKFQAGEWDVVVTDRLMPTLDGEKLAAAIKAINPNTQIVLMTGLAGELRDPSAYAAILEKPFRIDALLRAISGSPPP